MAQLTPPQKVACREYGFVVLPSKLDRAEINRQRAIFDRVFAPPSDGDKPLYCDLTGNDPSATMDRESVPQLLRPSHHVGALTTSTAWKTAPDIAK